MEVGISIIIPTFNRAHLFDVTLKSILAQTYSNWECIIVDDGSTDNTNEVVSEMLKKDNRFQFFKRPKDKAKGPNSCRNYGFEKAKGKFVLFFDSDDLMDANALENYISNFDDSIDAVIAPLKMQKNNLIKNNSIFSNKVLLDYFTGKIAYYVSGPIWRKNFLENQDYLFDEKVSNLDDWDFNLRMLYNSPNLKLINHPSFTYVINENSLSHEIEKLNIIELKSEIKIRNHHFSYLKKTNPNLIPEISIFLAQRYIYLLRLALIKKSKTANFLFFITQKQLLKSCKILSSLKITFGFFAMRIFNKGYSLLKL